MKTKEEATPWQPEWILGLNYEARLGNTTPYAVGPTNSTKGNKAK